MTPSIVLDTAADCSWLLGSPGGSRITTAVYQVLSDMIDQRMPLASAVAAPRLHHQASPDVLYLENQGFVPASIDSLVRWAQGDHLELQDRGEPIARTAAGWSVWPIPARRRRGRLLTAAD